MLEYVLRRLLYFIPISIGVTVLVFGLVHIAPGDPLNAVVGADAPAEVVEKLKKDYGFDKPLPVQYAIWLGRALTGDLGLSVVNNQPVVEALAIAVPNTLMLAITATLMGFLLGAVLGGLAGYFQGTWIDKFATG
ncbi:MAG: ABC transporter permease, partial [Alphaproteobacteria bacterium]|nr:ABC transporter permease [Alphaproteobacteria bacterium]